MLQMWGHARTMVVGAPKQIPPGIFSTPDTRPEFHGYQVGTGISILYWFLRILRVKQWQNKWKQNDRRVQIVDCFIYAGINVYFSFFDQFQLLLKYPSHTRVKNHGTVGYGVWVYYDPMSGRNLVWVNTHTRRLFFGCQV